VTARARHARLRHPAGDHRRVPLYPPRRPSPDWVVATFATALFTAALVLMAVSYAVGSVAQVAAPAACPSHHYRTELGRNPGGPLHSERFCQR
jgi:hypothetical protein